MNKFKVMKSQKNVRNLGRASVNGTKELSTKFESQEPEEGKVKDLTCKWVADMEYFIIAP